MTAKGSMDEKELYFVLAGEHVRAVEAEVAGVRSARDIECLHRMRVALRRLKATLSDFRELLPAREYVSLLGNVDKLLRALGQARDIDTKIAFLNALLSGGQAESVRAGILEIIDELAEDRSEIQPKILKWISRLRQKQVFRAAVKLRPALENTGMTLDEWARNRILARLEKFFSLEAYVRRPGCIRELHGMRIAAKNLRYTLENFSRLYGKEALDFAGSAMLVQRALGEVHSFDIWLGLLDILADSSGREPSFRRAVVFLRKECQSRRSAAYQSFLELWSDLKHKKTWARLGFFALDRS
jgi:CHAD domain-containing protein